MFDCYYKKIRQLIEKEIEEVNLRETIEAEGVSSAIKPIVEKFTIMNENPRSKRMRAVLCVLGYEMYGGSDVKTIMRAATALELFQTSVLGHDDIIDNSDLRRGEKSLHVSLRDIIDDDHYGISQCICLGDLGFFSAHEQITALKLDSERKISAIKIFNMMCKKTILGQILDVHLPYSTEKFDMEKYYSIIDNKTAWYSVIGPLQIGASLAGASREQLDYIYEYGLEVGRSFQIYDDYMGIFGDTKDTGKSNTADISENKRTLITVELERIGSEEDKLFCKSIFGQPDINIKDREQLIKIMKNLEIDSFVKNIINNHYEKSELAIGYFNVENKYVEYLSEICEMYKIR